MRFRRFFVLAIVVLAFGGVLAACGGDDDGNGGGGELSKDEFIEQADEICAEAEAKSDAVDDPRTAEGYVGWSDEQIEIGEETKAELEDLEPPSDVEDDFGSYLENVDETIALLEEIRTAAEAGDEDELRELLTGDEASQIRDENRELADDIGFEDCGREGSE
jgi:hypothetical protein